MIPKKATIRIYSNINIDDLLEDWQMEYLEREGFTDEEIKNKIEGIIRDSIWEYVPDNKISIEFD